MTTMCSPLSCACAIAQEAISKLANNVKRIRDMDLVLTRVLKSFQCFESSFTKLELWDGTLGHLSLARPSPDSMSIILPFSSLKIEPPSRY